MRTPADHGLGMFHGSFAGPRLPYPTRTPGLHNITPYPTRTPVVKLTTNGIRPAKPQNVPGRAGMGVTVNDAVPINTVYQPVGG